MHKSPIDTPPQERENDAFLLRIAVTYLHLESLYSMGPEHWPEDQDPLLLCMNRLLDVALNQQIHTPQGVMALIAMWEDGLHPKNERYGSGDTLEHKASRVSRDMLISGELVPGSW